MLTIRSCDRGNHNNPERADSVTELTGITFCSVPHIWTLLDERQVQGKDLRQQRKRDGMLLIPSLLIHLEFFSSQSIIFKIQN